MKINDKLGINPLCWGDKPLADFLAYFKGKAPEIKLKELHKECKSEFKKSTPKKV
jgi:hypothetical protein